ncbi:MAG: hypothetical protein IKL49_06770 [Lachnospiraceae bacterium]|nr:hypothetical protein [Lachnospiraceae bacterium]
MKKDEEKLKSRTSKIIIRKQISLDFNLTSYVFLFLTLIVCLNFGGIIYSIDTLSDIKNDVLRLDERIERVEEQDSSLYIEEEVNNYYRELSDKTDEAIDRILTIVGLLATILIFLFYNRILYFG